MKLLPIIIGKATHEMLWTVLFTYINKLVPENTHVFVIANANIFTIICCTIMPYYKYLMDIINFNSFFIIGLFSILIGYYSNKYIEF